MLKEIKNKLNNHPDCYLIPKEFSICYDSCKRCKYHNKCLNNVKETNGIH